MVYRPRQIIELAIVPGELDIVQKLFHEFVLFIFESFFDCSQIHGILDYGWVVIEIHALINVKVPFQSTGFLKS